MSLPVALLVVLCALSVPASALGHATLVGAQPPPNSTRTTPPDRLRMIFRTAVEDGLTQVEVRVDGSIVSATVERDPADDHAIDVTLGSHPPGSYDIRWRTLSVDGHVAAGRYGLAAGVSASGQNTPAPPSFDPGPLTVAGRTMLLSGLAGLAGLGAFLVIVLRSALGSLGVDDRSAVSLSHGLRRFRVASLACTVVAGIGVGLVAAGVVRALAGGVSVGDLVGTRIATAWSVICAALALTIVALTVARIRPTTWPWVGTATATLGGLGLIALSWSGHAGSGSDAGLGIAVDAVHGFATATWFGGLVGLAFITATLSRGLAPEVSTRVVAAVVVRFSSLAVVSVATLVVTGLYRALAEVGSPDALVSTSYGRILFVKLSVFLVLLSVGAVNRFLVHPRLERAAMGLSPDDRGATELLRRSIKLELLLAAALLVAVGALVSFSPTR